MDQMHWNSVGENKWITKRSVCKHPPDVVKELSDSCILISAMRVEQGRHEPGHSPPSARVLHHCRLCFSTLLHCEHPCAWTHRYILNNSDPHPQKDYVTPQSAKCSQGIGWLSPTLPATLRATWGNNRSGRGKPSQEFHFTSALSHFLPNRNLSNVLRAPPGRGKLPHFTCNTPF